MHGRPVNYLQCAKTKDDYISLFMQVHLYHADPNDPALFVEKWQLSDKINLYIPPQNILQPLFIVILITVQRMITNTLTNCAVINRRKGVHKQW